MTTIRKGPFRADHVGSFLRPARLKQARQEFSTGHITKEALRKVEDACILELIEQQKEAGMIGITDGEFRRKYWHYDFIEEIQGITGYEEPAPGFFQGEMTKLDKYVVSGSLSFPEDHSFIKDFQFMKDAVGPDHVVKQTIPGPNMIFHSGVIANDRYEQDKPYKTLEEVADAIATLYQDIIESFYQAGCRYLQLDDTSWGAFFDGAINKSLTIEGYTTDQLLEIFANITIDSLKNKREDMAVTIHICRGNFKSAWLYEGDYEAVAKQLFERVNVDGFFLEFDTDRAGSFEPLRYIQNQKVVLGLLTTKTGELEDAEEVKKRIQEATKYVPLEQLAISPQCGFASTEEGNIIDAEDQWKKLRLLKQIALDVWPS